MRTFLLSFVLTLVVLCASALRPPPIGGIPSPVIVDAGIGGDAEDPDSDFLHEDHWTAGAASAAPERTPSILEMLKETVRDIPLEEVPLAPVLHGLGT